MAAYAVIARIGRVDPHLARRDIDLDFGVEDGPPTSDPGLPDDRAALAPVLVERAALDPFDDRLTRFRERWAQTTFFLFDAESWRT